MTTRFKSLTVAFILFGLGSSAACTTNDPAAQGSPEPTITAMGAPFNDGELSEAILQDMNSGDYVVAQCTGQPAQKSRVADYCDMTATVEVRVSASDPAVTPFEARRFIAVGTRREVDCLVDRCFLSAIAGPKKVLATARMTFADNAIAAPTLRIGSPARFEKKSSLVALSGEGFETGTRYNLVQCPGDEIQRRVAAGDCLYAEGITVMASADGTIKTRMRVFRQFQRSNGDLVDCGALRSDCVIASVWPPQGRGRMAITPLRLHATG